MTRTYAISTACLLSSILFHSPLAAEPGMRPGLAALHDGRFDEASRFFSRVAREEPSAPEGPFFEAFHHWWRLIDRPEDTDLRLAMEGRLAEAARRARALADSTDATQLHRALVFEGVSQLLDAQSKAARGSQMSAATSARKGHRALTEALRIRPDAADALFAMGAYNYYADHLPLLVKGIRFLLRIPGGDAQLGIAQLERAGESSPLFGTEALMLLGHIFSGAYEEDHGRALGYVERALGRGGSSSPLLALARADLLYRLGRLGEADEASRKALTTVQATTGYPRELERALALRAAACTLKRHDPLRALEQIEALLDRLPPETSQQKRRCLALWAEAAREAGRPERLERLVERLEIPPEGAITLRKRAGADVADPVALERAVVLRRLAEGHEEEARSRLERLVSSHPDDPRPRYDLGRLLQADGRFDEALGHLEAVAGAGRTSTTADLAGWALLRMGWELEREGRRPQALPLYRRAADLRRFTFRPAALERLERAGLPQPEG